MKRVDHDVKVRDYLFYIINSENEDSIVQLKNIGEEEFKGYAKNLIYIHEPPSKVFVIDNLNGEIVAEFEGEYDPENESVTINPAKGAENASS